ncbi:MAG: glycosyltransferase [Puniceicoccales bacterium]|jgi:glycosyltransferase involved in cell wall biosynthesis|nr:glycosyltransferase [Puniceicoccales bacterium]
MLLSVIVPIYCKPPQFLQECIESILAQTLSDFELILIDDASPDNPMDVLRGYALRDRRIKLIHFHKNRGVAAARNTGLRMAQGKYIAFIDADDSVDVLYFETLITIAEQFSLDIVVANTNDFCTVEQLKPIHPFYLNKKIENIPLRTLNVQHFICRLFRRSTVGLIAFDEHLHMGEDILFIHRAMLVATRCMEIRYRGYCYRHAPENLMRDYCKKFTSTKCESLSLQQRISEMLYLVDQLNELKNFSKAEEDMKFIYYFSLRRLLRYSNFIWKLEENRNREIYWQKFCALFQKKFSKKVLQMPCFNVYMSWIFSQPKPFFGIRFFLYWARVLWEVRHIKQNFYRFTRIFKLTWKGYIC